MENKIEIYTFAKECVNCRFGTIRENELFVNAETLLSRHFECEFKEKCKHYAERQVE